MFRQFAYSAGILALLAAPVWGQGSSTILILDESGSMWAQLPEGRSRIEVARNVLGDYLTTRDPAAPLGVVAYGHNRKGDCRDIETIATVAPQDGAALSDRLRALMPLGKTPLAEALRQAGAEIPATSEEVNIVLITDGLETCGGDPCAVAAELAAAGIPVRAHIVGLGLTEGEISQIACIAEQTGGLILAPQSGAELADALIRTTEPVARTPEAPGTAALNLTIKADIAGRPDRVTFTAENLVTAEILPLGDLDFATAAALAVDLAEGQWLLRADAGELGRGTAEVAVIAGDNRTIYVPFQGLLPALDMPLPTGAFRAGINGLLPYRITQEGLATGGGDFVTSILPRDAVDTDDRRITYNTQESRLGGHVAAIGIPPEPGQYLVAFHRNGSQPIEEVLRSFVITVAPRPEVVISAPAAAEPGARVPVSISGGMGNSDRIEIWRDGALYSWDQSVYLQEFFDNRYGPAKPLIAPAEPGAYEIVYLFSELYDAEAIAARVPLLVGDGALLEEAALDTETQMQTAALSDDIVYSCAAPVCMITDPATGLSFALPQGWFTDQPTLQSATAGGQPGNPRVTFMREAGGVIDTIVLNPHQWTAMNGPCMEVPMGQLCQFEGEAADPAMAAMLAQTLRWDGAIQQDPAAGHSPDDDPLRAQSVFDCTGEAICTYEDPAAQFVTVIPAGWSVTAATRGATRNGDGRLPLHVTFFSKMEIPDLIVVNPVGWSDADGPCMDIQAGQLCRTEPGSDMVLPAFDMISRSLRDTAPRELATPAEALATVMNDLAVQDPGAAAAMGALLGTAQSLDLDSGAAADAGAMMGAVIGNLMGATDPAALPPPDTTVSSGVVLHTCGNTGACVFEQPDLAISGALPPGWQVEVAEQRPDLRISTWFIHRDAAGNVKRLGLNQPDSGTCQPTALGPLCHYTASISSQEDRLIARSLGYGLKGDVAARLGTAVPAAQPVDADALSSLLQSLEGN